MDARRARRAEHQPAIPAGSDIEVEPVAIEESGGGVDQVDEQRT
jgi:hypothetical protein